MKKQEQKVVVQDKPTFIKLLRDPNRFRKLEDGWVRDSLLGIEWGPSSRESMTFKQAQAYCKKLKARLPEVNELQSLVDYTKYDPAIDTSIFADTVSNWYWSGTTHAGHSDYAWIVSFYNGFVNWYNKGYSNYVRPVRPSQC